MLLRRLDRIVEHEMKRTKCWRGVRRLKGLPWSSVGRCDSFTVEIGSIVATCYARHDRQHLVGASLVLHSA